MRPGAKKILVSALALSASLGGAIETANAATGRLIVTGGATMVEGSAGGGIVPLAFITGLGARDEIGGVVFASNDSLDDHDIRVGGFGIGLYDRVEFTFSHINVIADESLAGQVLGNTNVETQVLGVKVKVAGDAMYSPDIWLPQIAVGVQYKRNLDDKLMDQLGVDDDGWDVYVAATKVYHGALFGRNIFLNGVLRATKANQIGAFGFGNNASSDDDDDEYSLVFEASAGVLLTTKFLIGGEYRQKPNNDLLGGAVDEDDWWTAFAAWFPNKHVALVAAYTNFGTIGLDEDQDGIYTSIQVTY